MQRVDAAERTDPSQVSVSSSRSATHGEVVAPRRTSAPVMHNPRLRPNALTVLRIAAVPALAWLATCGSAMFFVAVLIACLIGDVVANSG